MADNNKLDREFLGQGLAFPLQVNPRGEVSLARGARDIDQSIRIILSTRLGERVMRPEFGCRAHELIFAPRDAATAGLMKVYVEEALGRWEPRIEVTDVLVSNDPDNDAAILVEIKYQIKTTHDERSIIYPFFLQDEEE